VGPPVKPEDDRRGRQEDDRGSGKSIPVVNEEGWLVQFITLITMLFFVLFLNFAIIRPHRRRQRSLFSMLASIREGSVIYAGGIRGTVLEVRQNSVLMSTGPRRTLLEIDKSAVDSVENID
jgi:preprotein translocase subunit YajC